MHSVAIPPELPPLLATSREYLARALGDDAATMTVAQLLPGKVVPAAVRDLAPVDLFVPDAIVALPHAFVYHVIVAITAHGHARKARADAAAAATQPGTSGDGDKQESGPPSQLGLYRRRGALSDAAGGAIRKVTHMKLAMEDRFLDPRFLHGSDDAARAADNVRRNAAGFEALLTVLLLQWDEASFTAMNRFLCRKTSKVKRDRILAKAMGDLEAVVRSRGGAGSGGAVAFGQRSAKNFIASTVFEIKVISRPHRIRCNPYARRAVMPGPLSTATVDHAERSSDQPHAETLPGAANLELRVGWWAWVGLPETPMIYQSNCA